MKEKIEYWLFTLSLIMTIFCLCSLFILIIMAIKIKLNGGCLL